MTAIADLMIDDDRVLVVYTGSPSEVSEAVEKLMDAFFEDEEVAPVAPSSP